MIEELIQAAHKAFYERHSDWNIVPLDGHPRSHIVRADLEHEIRAILQRLKEPSEEMLKATDGITQDGDEQSVVEIWQAMITAISEQKG